jgi:hypothetical protein
MTDVPEPHQLREVVDRLEEENVDVDRAAEEGSDESAEDTTRNVPGAAEPPD